MGRVTATTGIVVFAAIAAMTGCAAARRPAVRFSPDVPREALLAEGRRLGLAGDYPGARVTYEEALRRDGFDDEARAALARVESWAGHLDAAQLGYRAVLVRHPHDVEVRAGLIDTLLWQGRLDDAARELDAGSFLDGESSLLAERRARLDTLRQELAPTGEARARRDRIFRGEVRLTVRNEFYPSGWDDVPAAELSLTQTVGHVVLTARTEQSRRYASVAAPLGLDYNALYFLGASYLFTRASVSVELGLGAPAPVVARGAARIAGTVAFGRHLSVGLAYALRLYDSGQSLHLVNPLLVAQVNDDLRFEARYWLAYVRLSRVADGSTPQDVVHSFGGRAYWRVVPRVEVGAEYVYGAQAERAPGLSAFATLRSHAVALWADWLPIAAFGLRPLYRFESRAALAEGAAVPIHTLELGVYSRW